MIITIDPADSRPIYVQITDEVRRCIATGAAKADDPLPSVRDLARDLRINPNTVQQAYRELERERLVYVRRGRGTFVSTDGAKGAGAQRKRLAEAVASRALQDAYRHGLTADDLVNAIDREKGATASRGDEKEKSDE